MLTAEQRLDEYLRTHQDGPDGILDDVRVILTQLKSVRALCTTHQLAYTADDFYTFYNAVCQVVMSGETPKPSVLEG